MEKPVLEILQGKDLDKPIFARIPKEMDVYSYRGEYATTRLNGAEEIDVSHDLGHNRIDLIRGHYIRRK